MGVDAGLMACRGVVGRFYRNGTTALAQAACDARPPFPKAMRADGYGYG